MLVVLLGGRVLLRSPPLLWLLATADWLRLAESRLTGVAGMLGWVRCGCDWSVPGELAGGAGVGNVGSGGTLLLAAGVEFSTGAAESSAQKLVRLT